MFSLYEYFRNLKETHSDMGMTYKTKNIKEVVEELFCYCVQSSFFSAGKMICSCNALSPLHGPNFIRQKDPAVELRSICLSTSNILIYWVLHTCATCKNRDTHILTFLYFSLEK